MSTANKEINEWFNNGCEYASGVLLLTKYSNKRALIKFLNRGTVNDEKRKHLEHHLREIAEIKVEDIALHPAPDFTESLVEDEKGNKYPKEVVALKKEKQKLYINRAKEHKKFHDLGTSNDDETKAKRKAIKETVENLANEIEIVDKQIVAILNGNVPVKTEGNGIASMLKNIFSKDIPLPAPGEPLTAEQVLALGKAKSNLTSSISKAKSKFDSTPDGPKKQQYADKQKELEQKRDQIEEILKAVK